jgi:hypothetical protein
MLPNLGGSRSQLLVLFQSLSTFLWTEQLKHVSPHRGLAEVKTQCIYVYITKLPDQTATNINEVNMLMTLH